MAVVHSTGEDISSGLAYQWRRSVAYSPVNFNAIRSVLAEYPIPILWYWLHDRGRGLLLGGSSLLCSV